MFILNPQEKHVQVYTWVDGWMDVKGFLSIACSNKKRSLIKYDTNVF